MLESKVVGHFIARAIACGGQVRKIKYVGQRHATDCLLVLPVNRVYFIELKRPGGKARDGQLREHARLRGVGADVRVLDTIELVDAFFNEVAP
jgi:VRR-NUC domain.